VCKKCGAAKTGDVCEVCGSDSFEETDRDYEILAVNTMLPSGEVLAIFIGTISRDYTAPVKRFSACEIRLYTAPLWHSAQIQCARFVENVKNELFLNKL
jgi:hypothetical protein